MISLVVALAALADASLRGYEYVPPATRPSSATLATWRQIAADAQEDPVIRGRALTRLSLQADPEDAALSRALLAPTHEPLLRAGSAQALVVVGAPAAALRARLRRTETDSEIRGRLAPATPLRRVP